jgi:histidinol phosphatase-like enzyme
MNAAGAPEPAQDAILSGARIAPTVTTLFMRWEAADDDTEVDALALEEAARDTRSSCRSEILLKLEMLLRSGLDAIESAMVRSVMADLEAAPA